MEIWRNKTIVRVFKFLVTGGTSALLNIAIVYGATEYLGVWYGLSLVIAGIIAGVFNFIVQKLWVFKEYSRDRVARQLTHYAVAALSNIALNELLLIIAVEVFGLWYMGAHIGIQIILACLNFFLYRTIFKTYD